MSNKAKELDLGLPDILRAAPRCTRTGQSFLDGQWLTGRHHKREGQSGAPHSYGELFLPGAVKITHQNEWKQRD